MNIQHTLPKGSYVFIPTNNYLKIYLKEVISYNVYMVPKDNITLITREAFAESWEKVTGLETIKIGEVVNSVFNLVEEEGIEVRTRVHRCREGYETIEPAQEPPGKNPVFNQEKKMWEDSVHG